MSERILLIEDEVGLQEAIAYTLQKQGYVVEVAGDGLQGLELARRLKPDLLILDIMLPGLDGLEVCKILRREGAIFPILMLTARAEEVDRVVGLELGADDYLTKPFSLRELAARVKAHLRRQQLLREVEAPPAPSEADTLTFGNLQIHRHRREVVLEGKVLALKPKEYELLLYLAEHRGRMLTRERILEEVWGWDYIGDSRTVDVHIRWLRQKIEPDPSAPQRIVTVRGGGYRFEG